MEWGEAVRVYRIQDSEGRGPFKPGFSHRWTDEEFAPGMGPMPAWGDEFGWDLIKRLGFPNEHFGTAVRSLSDLNKWFSRSEQSRLWRFGYLPVTMRVDRVLAESENQLVFARRRPLNRGVVFQPWPGESVPAALGNPQETLVSSE